MMKSTKSRIGFSAAASAIVILAVTGTTLAGPFNPQNGDCKFVAQNAVGPTQETAQAAWVNLVAGKFGTKWAHWVGAKNKAIVPMNGYYTAIAKPCFYQPVL
jgi:hypothetical protein